MDGSTWSRPRGCVLDDRQYVYQASSDVNGGTVTIGYPHSLMEWCAEPQSSWSLAVDVRCLPSVQTAQEVGAEQIYVLVLARAEFLEALDVIAADGKFGNAGFLRGVKGLCCGILACLRCDQMLYRQARPRTGNVKGHLINKVRAPRHSRILAYLIEDLPSG